MDYIDLENNQQPDSPFKLRWTGKCRTVVSASLRLAPLLIYTDFSGNITALDEATGQKVWATRMDKGILDPLFIFQGLVWALDIGGTLGGFDPKTGQAVTRYPLPTPCWDLQHHDKQIYFLHRTSHRTQAANIRPARMNLLNGRVSSFTDGFTAEDEGRSGQTWLIPEENAVLFFINPALYKFSMDDNRLLARWEIPNCHDLSGLAYVNDTAIGITELTPCQSSRIGARRYLDCNPTPLIFIKDGQISGYPLLARGIYNYRTSILKLSPTTTLIEAGETVFRLAAGEIVQTAALPNRTIYGNRSAGMFQIGDQILICQMREAIFNHTGYYLQIYTCDPDTLQITPLGAPLLTNPHGRNFKGASVDQQGKSLFLRCDRRYHYLRWAE